MATVKHVENVAQTQLDTNMAKTKPVKLGWKPELQDLRVIIKSAWDWYSGREGKKERGKPAR